MPILINMYKCSICGKRFNDYASAEKHEAKCNKCNSCTHAFYVYGCEFDCAYLKTCRAQGFSEYKKKK